MPLNLLAFLLALGLATLLAWTAFPSRGSCPKQTKPPSIGACK